MKQKNIQFKDIKKMLSRDEMKQIKGGCGSTDKPCTGTIVQVAACAWKGKRAQSTGPGIYDWECCI
ncbi:MAG: hypothetical protein JSS98_03940 [Bacteroidetes bacterium]|nr:hypothetical protein [Bacteroidota bacterium]